MRSFLFAKHVSVIDIGSHAVHLDIFDIRDPRKPITLYSKGKHSTFVKSVAVSEKITPSEIRHLKGLLIDVVKKAKKYNSDPLLIVATAAFRKALNGVAVIRELEKAAQVKIRLLEVNKESELDFLAIQSELEPDSKQLFINCGGDSTDIFLSKGRKRVAHATLPFGCETLSLQIKHNPPQLLEFLQMSKMLFASFGALPKFYPPRTVLISGNCVKLLHYFSPKGTAKEINCEELNTAALSLLRKKSKKIADKYGIERQSTARLLPAALIVLLLLRHYNVKNAAISQKGLRDGILLDFLKNPTPWLA